MIARQTGKERSLRRSFKLDVLPAEAQAKTACSNMGTIPIPRIIGKSWNNALPVASDDVELLPLNPAYCKHVSKSGSEGSEDGASSEQDFSSSSQRNPILQHTVSESVHASRLSVAHIERKPVLQHARSLDDLLAAHKRITIILNSDRTSKYSNMTITASTNMLNDNVEPTTNSASGNSEL